MYSTYALVRKSVSLSTVNSIKRQYILTCSR